MTDRRRHFVGQLQKPRERPDNVELIVNERPRYSDIQKWIDSDETDIVIPPGDYLFSKGTGWSTDFPNGDQPCLFMKNKTGVTLRGEGKVRFLVNEHAQGILEMQGCTDCTIENIEFVGPTDFPDLDGTTGRGEKGTSSQGYDTSSIWGNNKNNSSDTSANTGGGFGGNFPQYTGGTASSWGTWNNGYIGNVSFGLLIQKGCVRVTVKNCRAVGFNYCGFGVGHLGDSTYTTNEDIRFLDCVSRGNYSAGIHSLAVDGLLVKNCTLADMGHPDATPASDTHADPGYGYTARGVATYYTKNAVVEGCLINFCTRKGLDSHASERIQFLGNTIRDCGANGISVPWTSSTQPVKMTVIKGNIIENSSYANTNIGAIVGGGAIDAGYQGASSYCDLIISENIIEDCGGNGIEIKNGRNIQITNNIIRGFDDRASGSKYFMFLGRVSASEDLYNLNCSGNICDADGDASMYRGIYVRRAINSQVNHNIIYMDHASASEGVRLNACTSTQAFGNIVYWDSGATTGNPLNLAGTDAFTVGNYADPDSGTLSYPMGTEGTTGEQEHRFGVPHLIHLEVDYNQSTSPGYTVYKGEDYVTSVAELTTYGTRVNLKNMPSGPLYKSWYVVRSSGGLSTGGSTVKHIYERAIDETVVDIGMTDTAGGGGSNVIASNIHTGSTLSVFVAAL